MRLDNLTILDEITLEELESSLDQHTLEENEPDQWSAFSWSVSRHHMFQQCKRQYYLNYYGSRRVREAKNKIVSAVWWLKQITSLKAWVGTVIHQAAKVLVIAHKTGHPVDEAQFAKLAAQRYHDGITASQRGSKTPDGQWVVLFEHVYPEERFSIDRGQAEAQIYDTVQVLLESDSYELIKSLPSEAIREVDESFQSFEMPDIPVMEHVKVFAIPDVLLLHDGQITIIDWKTGDTTKDGIRDQAGVYRFYAHQKYNIPQEKIAVTISDLGSYGENLDPPGGTPTLSESEGFIRTSIGSMLACLKDVAYNTASIHDFPMTDDLGVCFRCPFKRACWRH